jgi:hypothetical protein
MELTKDSIHLFVNGYPAMFIDGLYAQNPDTGADNRIPDAWFQQGVRPYFTSWINGGQHSPTRWHWDRVAVNPHNPDGSFAAPSAAPSFCLGQPNNTCPDGQPIGGGGGGGNSSPTSTPTPTQTTGRGQPTATPTATPTRTPMATATPTSTPSAPNVQTLTFNDLIFHNRPLNGQYPSGVVDWGSGVWWLSAPFGGFPTNSISFKGPSLTSGGFGFVSPRRVRQLDAYNGGPTTTTVTLTCAGEPTVEQTLAPGQLVTIQTHWNGSCSTLTIGSTNGWKTNFDNIVLETPNGGSTGQRRASR